jgi:hypothetical protein
MKNENDITSSKEEMSHSTRELETKIQLLGEKLTYTNENDLTILKVKIRQEIQIIE